MSIRDQKYSPEDSDTERAFERQARLLAENAKLKALNVEFIEAAILLLGQYDASGDFQMGGRLTNEPFLKFRAALAKAPKP